MADEVKGKVAQETGAMTAEKLKEAAAARRRIKSASEWPDWMIVPPGIVWPGRPVYPVRLRAKWTDTPEKGDRQAILWAMSDADEQLAGERAQGESARIAIENCKISIRAFDGKVFRQDGSMEGEFLQWWNEIGQKCRNLFYGLFLQVNRLSDEERDDFFADCVARVVPASVR